MQVDDVDIRGFKKKRDDFGNKKQHQPRSRHNSNDSGTSPSSSRSNSPTTSKNERSPAPTPPLPNFYGYKRKNVHISRNRKKPMETKQSPSKVQNHSKTPPPHEVVMSGSHSTLMMNKESSSVQRIDAKLMARKGRGKSKRSNK